MKFAFAIAALGLVALARPSGADSLPRRGDTDPRIRTAAYSPNEVYRLSGFVGYHVDLEFEPDESFVGISAGDPEALTYSAHENILTLRPKAPTAQMNLTVTTTKRRYYFDYTVFSRTPNRFGDEVMYAVRFSYPPQEENSLTPAEQVERDLAAARAARGRNVDYWFCGSKSIKPVSASDDGVHTRLKFGARGELPTVFVRNDDGSESLLNFSIDDGDVVIHRVAARFILRRGKLTGCVVNKGFAGGGERLESGTITPSVTRERKEVRRE
jgi:type IV secretion system protein VirB9